VKTPLLILGGGAVTAVGLTAVETCVSMRARMSGVTDAVFRTPPLEPILGAAVPASAALKRSALNWLVNLASRAIGESVLATDVPAKRVALIVAIPEPYRGHPATVELIDSSFIALVEQRLQLSFHETSCVMSSGHGAALQGVELAHELLISGRVDICIVGGVDSLLNRIDVERLSRANRLHNERNPQGVIPGEGAAFIALGRPDIARAKSSLATLLGVGLAREQDTVLGERFSTGSGLRRALVAALADANCEEHRVSFRVSDMNGERYRAWESFIASSRFYRTRREVLPTWLPASSVGDIGVASGALTLLMAATGLSRGYAPGPIAVCEASSDEGLRAACVLAPLPGAPTPPFMSSYPVSAE